MPVPKGTRIGGRQKGTPNKRTIETKAKTQAVAAAVEKILDSAFEGDAHAFLMSVYKDRTKSDEMRLDAAGKAIRYEKPALATIDVTSTNEHVVHTVSDKPLSAEQWAEQHATTH